MEQGVRSHPIPPLADITTSPHTSICLSSGSSWIGGMAIDPKSSSRHLCHDFGPYGMYRRCHFLISSRTIVERVFYCDGVRGSLCRTLVAFMGFQFLW